MRKNVLIAMAIVIMGTVAAGATDEKASMYEQAVDGIDAVIITGSYIGITYQTDTYVIFHIYIPRDGERGIHIPIMAKGNYMEQIIASDSFDTVSVRGYHRIYHDPDYGSQMCVFASKMLIMKE